MLETKSTSLWSTPLRKMGGGHLCTRWISCAHPDSGCSWGALQADNVSVWPSLTVSVNTYSTPQVFEWKMFPFLISRALGQEGSRARVMFEWDWLHRLIYLNVWFSAGRTDWEGLEGIALRRRCVTGGGIAVSKMYARPRLTISLPLPSDMDVSSQWLH